MATANILAQFDAEIGGEIKSDGSIEVADSITAAGGKAHDVVLVILNESGDNYNSATAWTTGDSGMTDFDFLWIKSDADVLVELRNDNSTDQFIILEVKANIPFMLGGVQCQAGDDGSLADFQNDGTAEADDTHLDDIDRIRIKNNADGSSTSVTATVRVVLMT